MDRTDYPYLLNTWLHEERAELKRHSKNFIGDRPYRHFDGRIVIEALESNTSAIVPLLTTPDLLGRHSFLPFIRRDKKVRRFTKEKISQKSRPIMYASHRDACIYAFYSYVLKERYEDLIRGTELDKSILAYRRIKRDDESGRGKSNIDFAKEIHELVRSYPRCAVLCLDVEKFFDRMDHQLIKKRWAELLDCTELPSGHYSIFRSVTNFRYVFLYEVLTRLGYGKLVHGKFMYTSRSIRKGNICTPQQFNKIVDSATDSLVHKNRTQVGIPQGSPISDIIANLYLRYFDMAVVKHLSSFEFGCYRRYSDDLLIVCPPESVKEIYEYICARMKTERLNIKQAKTEALVLDNNSSTVTDITYSITGRSEHEKSERHTLQYLGFEMDANDLHIRSGTVAMHYRRAKRRASAEASDSVTKKDPTHKRAKPAYRRNRSRWQYFINSEKRTGSTRIKHQLKKMVRRVRSFSVK